MSSLQEALRNAGLTSSDTKSRKKPNRKKATRSDESDLAKAYRARREAENAEIAQKKKAKQAEQQARRERNRQIEQALTDQVLNVSDGEVARYFQYGGRVRRVWCTSDQREALNAGQLAIVMFRGAPQLVDPQVAQSVTQFAPEAVPDLSQAEPDSPDGLDGYPPIPDDLIW